MPFRDVAPGPPSEPRALAPGLFLDRIEAEGFEAGVTRLADLTGLDRIGFPVWQAVRPFGRAQSVHQGKHASNLLARIGALGEALESHRAENAVVNIRATRWRDLPASARCPDPHDCNADRGIGEAHGALDWCTAREFRTDDEFFLPHLFVSLDFTLTDGHWLERSSAGLALGTCESEAIATGLREVLERDAVGAWERSSPAAKAHGRIDVASIPYGWFHHWKERAASADATLRVFATETIDGMPVCIVCLSGPAAYGEGQRDFMGSCAHGDPERALFGAMAEAIQSRLTVIAGSRDDVMPRLYRSTPGGGLLGAVELGVPLSSFENIEPRCSEPRRVADRLASLGYDRIVVARLAPEGAIPVVKVFVPGLGSLHRERRAPT
ncbi:YcaO-like family protein [Blastomonas marina]|uniref:YcaO-like family protein n=1 Tax=Blastomonas marina TaxID=1867408 RepID=UPI002AC9D53C|nr:YcaO-like family protein [Blastomonas marina]WPZ05253.1 YcaO-like family protein [Blastomonas marina]